MLREYGIRCLGKIQEGTEKGKNNWTLKHFENMLSAQNKVYG